jgi:hypothetical protein
MPAVASVFVVTIKKGQKIDSKAIVARVSEG